MINEILFENIVARIFEEAEYVVRQNVKLEETRSDIDIIAEKNNPCVKTPYIFPLKTFFFLPSEPSITSWWRYRSESDSGWQNRRYRKRWPSPNLFLQWILSDAG